jgi:[ribosomal protein S5]-alanine N-acetyltransferase
MPTRSVSLPATIRRRGFRICLRAPRVTDTPAFLAAAKASRRLHGAWVHAPSTPAQYEAFVRRYGRFARRDPLAVTHVALLACRCDDGAIVGTFIFGEVVRGLFQSAYMGYYAFAPHAGAGYMSEGLELALRFAFNALKLHRVEANVQPTNLRSLALVCGAGFVREGYSRRYVRIAGRWRDHVRMALLAEDWRAHRKEQP